MTDSKRADLLESAIGRCADDRLRDASTVRVVLCDDDEMLLAAIEAVITGLGHELIGVSTTSGASVGLIEHGKPHIVVIDPAIGYNDFDVVDAACAAGAIPVIFSHGAVGLSLDRYARRPLFVEKPDLLGLEQTLRRLDLDEADHAATQERRVRPTRQVVGPPPTNLADAQAFYEALNDVCEGDALLSIELPSTDRHGTTPLGELLLPALRGTDRLLASAAAVRILLPGGGTLGVTSLLRRIRTITELPAGTKVGSVVVRAGEDPMDAFDRLKQAPDPPDEPAPEG